MERDYPEIIISYFANDMWVEECLDALGFEVTNERCDLLAQAEREWNEEEVDEDWPTPEQDEVLDRIVENVWVALQE